MEKNKTINTSSVGYAATFPKGKAQGYVIHDFMVDELQLSGVALKVYALIYSFTKAGGDCHGSLEYIAARVGAARASVHRAIKQLLEDGHIKKLKNYETRTCRYVASLIYLSQNETDTVSNCNTDSLKMIPNNKDNNKDDNTNYNHSFIQESYAPLRRIGDKKLVVMTLHQLSVLTQRVGVLPTLRYIRKLEDLIIKHPEVADTNHFKLILRWYYEDSRVEGED